MAQRDLAHAGVRRRLRPGPRSAAQRLAARAAAPSHLDLFTDSAEEQQAEVRRLTGLGARAVEWDLYPPDPDFVVLADPDGNVFCVVDLSHAPSGGDRPSPSGGDRPAV
ncbi:VOC family protein [Streptomyces sp. enrichment culture]|uniref:VOC family protein n=1 Tax=Streptomyces sp. enrichment culture TaxID=1795815 RepID=UPI003F57CB6E